MAAGVADSGKPGPLLRLGLRAPIWLYRARLGWLLGKRFLMLTHTGRKSGRWRQTVVEVVDRDEQTGAAFVCAGWGRKSDWFQNIEKNPQVEVHLGAQRFHARAEELPLDEAVSTLHRYAERNPTAFRNLGKLMIGQKLEPTAADARRLAERAPVVALRPTG